MDKEDLRQISELMDQKFDEKLKPIQEDIAELRDEQRQTRVLVEAQEHNIRLIAEQHTDIVRRLDELRDYESLRDRVLNLEHAVRSHTAELDELKKAQ